MDDINSMKNAVMENAVYNSRMSFSRRVNDDSSPEEKMTWYTQQIRVAEDRVTKIERRLEECKQALDALDDSGIKNFVYANLERDIHGYANEQMKFRKQITELKAQYQAVYESSVMSNQEDYDIDDAVYVDDEKFVDKIVHEDLSGQDEWNDNKEVVADTLEVKSDVLNEAESDTSDEDDVPDTAPEELVNDSLVESPEESSDDDENEDDELDTDVDMPSDDENDNNESDDSVETSNEDSEREASEESGETSEYYVFCSSKNAFWRREAQDGLTWTGDLNEALLLSEEDADKKIEAINSIFSELELTKIDKNSFAKKEEESKLTVIRDIEKVYESAVSNGLAAVFGSDDSYNELLHVTSVFLTTTAENDVAIMSQMPNATMLKQKQGWINEYNLSQLFKKGIDDNSSIILAKQSINDERCLTEVYDVSQTMVSVKRNDVFCSNELMLKVLCKHYGENIKFLQDAYFLPDSYFFYDHTQNVIMARQALGDESRDGKVVYQLLREIAFYIYANEKCGTQNYVRNEESKGIAMAVAKITAEKLYSKISLKCTFPTSWKVLNQRNWLIDVFQNLIKSISYEIVDEIHEDIEEGLKIEKEKYHED